jgi:hypothetical protein
MSVRKQNRLLEKRIGTAFGLINVLQSLGMGAWTSPPAG